MTYFEHMESPEINTMNQVTSRFFADWLKIESVIEVEGGFSTASIYRLKHRDSEFALRRWPLHSQDTFPETRIKELHHFLLHLSKNAIPVAVPLFVRDSTTSVLKHRNMFWHCEPWLSGKPVASETLQPNQFKNAMQLLARMHLVSSQYEPSASGKKWFISKTGPCPTVMERRNIIASYTVQKLLRFQEKLRSAPLEFREPALESLHLYHAHVHKIDEQLRHLEHTTVSLNPCWRDLWHDHILFKNETITGLIDPTATRTDHIATDLTRLLGSWFPNDPQQWQVALSYYEQICPLTITDHQLITAFNQSAILLTPLTWIDRYSDNAIPPAQLEQVIARIETNLQRLRQLVLGSALVTTTRPTN